MYSTHADLIDIAWEDLPVLDTKSGVRESVLVNRLLVCMILLTSLNAACFVGVRDDAFLLHD